MIIYLSVNKRSPLPSLNYYNENKSMKDFIGAFGRHEDISYETPKIS